MDAFSSAPEKGLLKRAREDDDTLSTSRSEDQGQPLKLVKTYQSRESPKVFLSLYQHDASPSILPQTVLDLVLAVFLSDQSLRSFFERIVQSHTPHQARNRIESAVSDFCGGSSGSFKDSALSVLRRNSMKFAHMVVFKLRSSADCEVDLNDTEAECAAKLEKLLTNTSPKDVHRSLNLAGATKHDTDTQNCHHLIIVKQASALNEGPSFQDLRHNVCSIAWPFSNCNRRLVGLQDENVNLLKEIAQQRLRIDEIETRTRVQISVPIVIDFPVATPLSTETNSDVLVNSQDAEIDSVLHTPTETRFGCKAHPKSPSSTTEQGKNSHNQSKEKSPSPVIALKITQVPER